VSGRAKACACARREMSVQLLSVGSANGDVLVIQAQLTKGADPNQTASNGLTPLMLAAANGRRAAAEALLDGGADVHARNFEGETALHIAADHGHDGVVNLLLLRGHQVDLRGTDGATALHRTSQRGHVKCIARLLKGGADINSVFKKNTPLQWAAICHREKAEELLRKLGAKPHLHWNGATGEYDEGFLTQRQHYIDNPLPD